MNEELTVINSPHNNVGRSKGEIDQVAGVVESSQSLHENEINNNQQASQRKRNTVHKWPLVRLRARLRALALIGGIGPSSNYFLINKHNA